MTPIEERAAGNQRNRIEDDIDEIKRSVRRIEQSLTGTIVDGKTTVGVFEEIRGLKQNVSSLESDYKQVTELNKSIEALYRWKYMIVGGALVALFVIERAISWVLDFFKSKP